MTRTQILGQTQRSKRMPSMTVLLKTKLVSSVPSLMAPSPGRTVHNLDTMSKPTVTRPPDITGAVLKYSIETSHLARLMTSDSIQQSDESGSVFKNRNETNDLSLRDELPLIAVRSRDCCCDANQNHSTGNQSD